MSRHLLTLALLLLAATAQGMNPVHEDANGAGGSCPEAQATAQAEDPAAPATAALPAAAGPAPSPVAAPAQAKAPGATRASKAGDRWHSFLPGMFK